MFAVDGGSTQGVAEVDAEARPARKRGVRAGGYDLLPTTLRAIADRHVDFTIDQQPYLQGFLPILQLFLDKYSGGLVAPADTNTGPPFRHAGERQALPDYPNALRGQLEAGASSLVAVS